MGRINKSYTEKNVTDALEGILNGMSVRMASKKYNIPRSTLIDKYSGKSKLNQKCGMPTVLSTIEEDRIRKWVIDMAKRGFPPTKEKLITTVQLYLNLAKRKTTFTDNRPGRKWYRGFLNRHPDLAVRTCQPLTSSRSEITERKIRNWHQEVRSYLESNVPDVLKLLDDPNRIYNLDETAFYLTPKSDKVLTSKGSKSVHFRCRNDEKECVTTLVIGSASGLVPPPMIMHTQKRIPFSIVKNTPSSWGLGRSDSGWMTGETFYEFIANVFYTWLLEKSIPFPVLLYVDGYRSHLTLNVSEFCSEHNIILVALYPNATHILQPLDVAVFRPLKLQWKRAVYDWRALNNEAKVRKEDFARILEQALLKTNMASNLASGFRVCGLYPFDANAIPYAKLLVQLDEQELSLEPIPEPNAEVLTKTANQNTFAKQLQDKIAPDIFAQFQTAQHNSSWTGPVEYKALFDIWKKNIDVNTIGNFKTIC